MEPQSTRTGTMLVSTTSSTVPPVYFEVSEGSRSETRLGGMVILLDYPETLLPLAFLHCDFGIVEGIEYTVFIYEVKLLELHTSSR